MMARQMKFLLAAIGMATVIAALAVARTVHTRAAPADQRYGANTIVGSDGKLIGAAASLSIRSQLQREGLPH